MDPDGKSHPLTMFQNKDENKTENVSLYISQLLEAHESNSKERFFDPNQTTVQNKCPEPTKTFHPMQTQKEQQEDFHLFRELQRPEKVNSKAFENDDMPSSSQQTQQFQRTKDMSELMNHRLVPDGASFFPGPSDSKKDLFCALSEERDVKMDPTVNNCSMDTNAPTTTATFYDALSPGGIDLSTNTSKNKTPIPTSDKPPPELDNNPLSEIEKKNIPIGTFNTPMSTYPRVKPKCNICDKVCNNNTDLTIHMRTHTGEKPFVCSTCGKAFSQTGALNRHLRIHSGERPFVCSLCDKTFTQSGDLSKHMTVHTGLKPHKCSICKKGFNTSYELKVHLRIHSGEKPLLCSVCKMTFRRRSNLTQHLKIHTGEKYQQCTLCERVLSSKHNMIMHMKVHAKQKLDTRPRPHHCYLCKRSFIKKGHLNAHMLVHSGQKPFQCGVCQKTFNKKTNLKRHTIQMHESPRVKKRAEELPHRCGICKKGFDIEAKLKSHVKVHTAEILKLHSLRKQANSRGKGKRSRTYTRRPLVPQNAEKPHQCYICKKCFSQAGALSRHLRIHKGEKPHECPLCGKGFIQSGDLQRHLRTHTGEKNYQCVACEKYFNTSWQLKMHVRTHTGERPHECAVCKKKFRQVGALNSHLKIHTGEKYFPCNVCEKVLSSKENLSSHLKIHERKILDTKVRPHLCTQCKRAFTKKSHLKAHMLTHSGIKPHQCGVCELSFAQKANLKRHFLNMHKDEKLESYGLVNAKRISSDNPDNSNLLPPPQLQHQQQQHQQPQLPPLQQPPTLQPPMQVVPPIDMKFSVEPPTYHQPHPHSHLHSLPHQHPHQHPHPHQQHLHPHHPQHHQCGICKESFNSEAGLVAHMKLHTSVVNPKQYPPTHENKPLVHNDNDSFNNYITTRTDTFSYFFL